jgi:hypothetical protein
MSKKIHFNDIMEAKPADLKRIYKVDDRQLENAVRSHMDGANPKERRDHYEAVYNLKRKS